jgi:hypothetical protein
LKNNSKKALSVLNLYPLELALQAVEQLAAHEKESSAETFFLH